MRSDNETTKSLVSQYEDLNLSILELMRTLKHLVSKGLTKHVQAIASVAKAAIEKCSVGQLIEGFLDRKKTVDGSAGVTGLTQLLDMLSSWSQVSEDMDEAVADVVEAIADVAITVIRKCPEDRLVVEFSQIPENFCGVYFLGDEWPSFFLFTYALRDAGRLNAHRNLRALASVAIESIVKLNLHSVKIPDCMKRILFFRIKLWVHLQLYDYLSAQIKVMSIEAFEKMCSPATLLGALIDYHVYFGWGITKTREFVNGLIREATKAKQESLNKLLDSMDFNLLLAASPVLSAASDKNTSTQNTFSQPPISVSPDGLFSQRDKVHPTQQLTVLTADVIAYAKIWNQCAWDLFYHHDTFFGGDVDIKQDALIQLNAWKKVLQRDELEQVKAVTRLKWKKSTSDEDAVELQLQLASCLVPHHQPQLQPVEEQTEKTRVMCFT